MQGSLALTGLGHCSCGSPSGTVTLLLPNSSGLAVWNVLVLHWQPPERVKSHEKQTAVLHCSGYLGDHYVTNFRGKLFCCIWERGFIIVHLLVWNHEFWDDCTQSYSIKNTGSYETKPWWQVCKLCLDILYCKCFPFFVDLEMLVCLRIKFFVCFIFSWYEPNQNLKQAFIVKELWRMGRKKVLWIRHDLKI